MAISWNSPIFNYSVHLGASLLNLVTEVTHFAPKVWPLEASLLSLHHHQLTDVSFLYSD